MWSIRLFEGSKMPLPFTYITFSYKFSEHALCLGKAMVNLLRQLQFIYTAEWLNPCFNGKNLAIYLP